MSGLKLSPIEVRIVELSGDPQATRRRRTIVVIAGLTFAAALVVLALVTRSWPTLLSISLVYIGLTLFEKVMYANAILAYKGLIQKLKARIEELEASDESNNDA